MAASGLMDQRYVSPSPETQEHQKNLLLVAPRRKARYESLLSSLGVRDELPRSWLAHLVGEVQVRDSSLS